MLQVQGRTEPSGKVERHAICRGSARSPGRRKVLEQPITSRSRRFGREALAPEGSVERIDVLRFGPVQRVENADATDKIADVDLFTGPHAVATGQGTWPSSAKLRLEQM